MCSNVFLSWVYCTLVPCALIAEEASRLASSIHVASITALPAVLLDTANGCKVGDAVLLDTSGNLHHSLCRKYLAFVPAEGDLKCANQGASCIVCCGVGITMFEPECAHKISEPDLVTVRYPVFSVACEDLGINVSYNCPNAINVERGGLISQIVPVVAYVLAEDDNRMGSLDTIHAWYGLNEEVLHDLASFGESNEAALTKTVAVDTTGAYLHARQMRSLYQTEEIELDLLQ